ncbi:MAG: hypothetical protein QME52_08235 [Bacteroidota bacterium]|nr:hypothetical protein [Bacteroidota bacterium]
MEDRFEYAFQSNIEAKNIYRYFKIASAEDPHFRIVTGRDESVARYDRREFGMFSPELLSVIYLTFLLFNVKELVKGRLANPPRRGLLGLILPSQPVEPIFTIQLGIPTEYSKNVNLMRRRKFENILLISEMLQDTIGSASEFSNLRTKEVVDLVRDRLSNVEQRASNLSRFSDLLNEYRISVYPEAAAGLTFLVKTKRLEPGHYVALDIGGGSSDLSYFSVEQNNKIRYLASEAFIIAANDVYREFSQNVNKTFKELHGSEKAIVELIKLARWEDSRSYIDAIERVSELLYGRLYLLFNERVYWYFERYQATQTFQNQPCFVYGGGARLPITGRLREICIHDNGQRLNPDLHTRVRRTNIDDYLPSVDILPADNSWKKDFSLLVVAFGLSFPHADDEAYWDPSDYKGFPPRPRPPELVPHPFNEDMYIYDVLEARWRV